MTDTCIRCGEPKEPSKHRRSYCHACNALLMRGVRAKKKLIEGATNNLLLNYMTLERRVRNDEPAKVVLKDISAAASQLETANDADPWELAEVNE